MAGRSHLFGLGVFGGSNGFWRASALKAVKMDESMLTEDIDSSIRAMLAGYRIGYSPHIISSELSPLTLTTLQKQRLRWAQGWFQVSFKHMIPVLMSKQVTIGQKIGCVFLLAWREVFAYLILHPIMLIIISAARSHLVVTELYLAMGGVIFALGISRTIVAYKLAQGPARHNIGRFILFAVVQIIWSVYMNYVQVLSHAREMLQMHTWTATVREQLVTVQTEIVVVMPV